MSSATAKSLKAEESRIREAYARRRIDDLYSCFNPGYLFMVQEREKRLLKLLACRGFLRFDTKKILEIGCGTGALLREFVKWGARPENVTGIELLPDRVREAAHLCPKAMRIEHGNAARLTYQSEHFDLVIQSTVFTSVLDSEMRRQMASEMLRVLKPDGMILWYDYHMNNPRNPDVRSQAERDRRTVSRMRHRTEADHSGAAHCASSRAILLASLLRNGENTSTLHSLYRCHSQIKHRCRRNSVCAFLLLQ